MEIQRLHCIYYRLFHASYRVSVHYPQVSLCWKIPLVSFWCRSSSKYTLVIIIDLVITIAVIRNMAFETVAFRKEIQTFRGIEAMIKV